MTVATRLTLAAAVGVTAVGLAGCSDDSGASASTGFTEMIDQPPRPAFESALYGAAGVAQHVGLTKLLLERGADPNDEETPYHVPETYDNAVLTVLLESGRLNADSLATLLLRKADWHDTAGVTQLLAAGARRVRRAHSNTERTGGESAIDVRDHRVHLRRGRRAMRPVGPRDRGVLARGADLAPPFLAVHDGDA